MSKSKDGRVTVVINMRKVRVKKGCLRKRLSSVFLRGLKKSYN